MDAEINLLGVLAAALSAVSVGFIWYSKGVFGLTWMKLVGINEKRARKQTATVTLFMFVLALVTAYVLAHLVFILKQFYPGLTYREAALATAVWVWLGFVLFAMASQALIEMRSRKLLFIDISNQLLTLLVMGLVLGMIGI